MMIKIKIEIQFKLYQKKKTKQVEQNSLLTLNYQECCFPDLFSSWIYD